TIVVPRRVATLFIGRDRTSSIASDVSITSSISSGDRTSVSSRSLRSHRCPSTAESVRGSVSSMCALRFDQVHAVFAVDFAQADAHRLTDSGWQVLAYKVRADRQLAMAPVDQDGESHASGAAEVHDPLKCRA